MPNRTFRILMLFIAFAANLAACTKVDDDGCKSPVMHYVEVKKHSIPLTSRLQGRISSVIVSEVRPQVDGIILERLFSEGALVTRGQALYQIDPALYEAARNVAQAELMEAEAKATALGLQEKRGHSLARNRAVSQQDLENSISEYAQARANVARARAELEKADINLAYTTVRAPISGRIGVSNVSPGALVTAGQSAPLATIRQTDEVHVDMTQPSAEYLRLRQELAPMSGMAGKNRRIRLLLQDGTEYALRSKNDATPPQTIYGKLVFDDISVAQGTGAIFRRGVFANPEGLLLPGMAVTAIVDEGMAQDVLLLPQAAVLPGSGGAHHVLVLHRHGADGTDFTVEKRAIALGRTIGNNWHVREGLVAGELVLTDGFQSIGDNADDNAIVKAVRAGD